MSLVEYSNADGVATITMNDGRANIMSAQMLGEIMAALDEAGNDFAAAVIRSGMPSTFSAGFDVNVFAARDPQSSLDMVRAGGELIHKMLRFPRPIIGVADGQIYPMGLFILLASDYRIGTERDYHWALNEVEIGIVPPRYAFELLRYRMSNAWMTRAMTTASRFGPRQAIDAGVLDELVASGELEALVSAVAAKLQAFPPHVFAGIKKRLTDSVVGRVRQAIDAEQTLETYQRLLGAK
ncbi:MAG: crotonase/enoyl-CoA hydratase family protein [Pseudomonadota bacterium]